MVDRGAKFDDGNYFEVTSDGKVKLKGDNKQIDLSKLSKDDLKKMGIDPDSMTKEEISRKLKVLKSLKSKNILYLVQHLLSFWTQHTVHTFYKERKNELDVKVMLHMLCLMYMCMYVDMWCTCT